MSNLVVLGTGVIIFEFMDDPDIEFLLVAIIAQVVGMASSFFFLCVIKERKLSIGPAPAEENHLEHSLLEKEDEEGE